MGRVFAQGVFSDRTPVKEQQFFKCSLSNKLF